jgi:ribosomal protein S1
MEEDSFPRGRPAQDAPSEADKKQPDRGRSREKSARGSGDKKRSAAESSDFLFGGGAKEEETKARSASKKSKKAKTTEKAASTASQSLLPLGGGGVVHPTNKEAWIEPLSFTKLAKGFKLLGCVRAVQDDLILFSLPNMWTGYMLVDDIKKNKNGIPEWSCRQMVQPGQMLSVVILKAVQEDTPSVAGKSGQRRRIQVTCLPNKMNPLELTASSSSSVRGQVLSVEDHGLLVDLGMSRRGFLPFDEIKGDYTTDDDEIAHDDKRLLHVGSIHDFTVRPGSAADVKILPLSMPSRKQGAKQFLPGTHTPPLAALQPGTLVHAKVERVVRNGLCVSFGGDNGVFRGAIEVNHLGSYWVPDKRHESIEWKAIFESHRSLTARIVAVDAATKIVRLSLQPHILDLTQAPALPPVGSIFEEATVIRIDPGVGALLALPDRLEEDAMPKRIHKPVSVEDTYGEASRVQAVYVHISKAMDEKGGGKTSESTFSKEFAPSTKHSVRILSTSNGIDGIASGATSDSIIAAHVLTHADLLPGKVYHNVPVLAQLNGGAILVDFGLGVRGLIPPLQLFDQAADSDYRAKMSKVKYAVGAKVDVRVLSVDVEAKRCVVTAKKTLIKADDVISSYDHIKLGDKGAGFISKVDDRGLSVTLFGGVYGRVTARSLVAELGVEDHKQNYQVGDVVHCRIVNIKKRKSRNMGRDDMDVDETDETSSAYWELTLSLKVHSDGDMELDADTPESKTSAQTVSLRAGAILPLKSLRIVELVRGRAKQTGFVSGHAIVRIKSKFLVEGESESSLPYIECKLPYDQLLDEYDENDIESAESLDALAEKLLSVGKKIDREGLVMTDPRKSRAEYSSATGKLTVVSIRPKLVNAAKLQLVPDKEKSSKDLILPRPDTQLYMGAKLQGYVAQVDARFGAFVRFLDGMTGLVPKLKGGNDMPLFSTVETRIVALDVTTRPVKILLSRSMSKSKKDNSEVETEKLDIHVGDLIGQAQVDDLDFHRAKLQILDAKWAGNDKVRARVHCTMAESKSAGKVTETMTEPGEQAIKKGHPFYKWKVGMELSNLSVVAVDCRAGTYYIELTNRKMDAASKEDKSQLPSFFFASSQQLVPGQKVSGIVSSANQKRGGLWINLSPGVSAFLPALELSLDPKVLNNLEEAYPVGSRLECSVMDKLACDKTRAKLFGTVKKDENKKKSVLPFLTLLRASDSSTAVKPIRGDLVVGRINRSFPDVHSPALMLELRGGYVGRCCITEIEEVDDWGNMPFGRVSDKIAKSSVDPDGMDVDSDAEDDEVLEAIRYVSVKCSLMLHEWNCRFSL